LGERGGGSPVHADYGLKVNPPHAIILVPDLTLSLPVEIGRVELIAISSPNFRWPAGVPVAAADRASEAGTSAELRTRAGDDHHQGQK